MLKNKKRNIMIISVLTAIVVLYMFYRHISNSSKDKQNIVIHCMDYRFTSHLGNILDSKLGKDSYYVVSIAGSTLPLGHDSNITYKWRQTIEDHIVIANKLSTIKNIILIHHEDCGAFKMVLNIDNDIGEESIKRHHNIMNKSEEYIQKVLKNNNISDITIQKFMIMKNHEFIKLK